MTRLDLCMTLFPSMANVSSAIVDKDTSRGKPLMVGLKTPLQEHKSLQQGPGAMTSTVWKYSSNIDTFTDTRT
jgi:hypothetical protein